MNIIFDSSSFNRNADAKYWVRDFIEKCIRYFLKEDQLIDEIVVADDSSFGRQISRIQNANGSPLGYTNNNGNTAIAKVIKTNGTNSSIVFREFIFGGIYGESLKTQVLEEWNRDVQLFYYTIFHELAHCKDSVLRTSHHSEQSFKRSLFKVSILKEHYIAALFSEFAACSLSKEMMPDPVFEKELLNTAESLNAYLPNLINNKSRYFLNQVEKVDIAYEASQLAWFIIVQISKLIGSNTMHYPRYRTDKIIKLLHQEYNIRHALLTLEYQLSKIWEHYPTWPIESGNPFFEIWKEIVESFGFVFNDDYLESLEII